MNASPEPTKVISKAAAEITLPQESRQFHELPAHVCMSLLHRWANLSESEFRNRLFAFDDARPEEDRIGHKTLNYLFNKAKRYDRKKGFIELFLKSIKSEKFHEYLLSREIVKFCPLVDVSFEMIRDYLPEDYKKFARMIAVHAKSHDHKSRKIIKIEEGMIMKPKEVTEFMEKFAGIYMLYRQAEATGETPYLCREFFRIQKRKQNRILVKYINYHGDEYTGSILISNCNLTSLLCNPNPTFDNHCSVNINLYRNFLEGKRAEEEREYHLYGMMNFSCQDDKYRSCRVLLRKMYDDKKDSNLGEEQENVAKNSIKCFEEFSQESDAKEAITYFTAVYNRRAQSNEEDSNFLISEQATRENYFSGQRKASRIGLLFRNMKEENSFDSKINILDLDYELSQLIKQH